ncbi:MAG TPA: amidase [Pirellulaceae bacterium]|nr:amidase [Pirellulaceae bacterium]
MITRRIWLGALAGLGVGTATFRRALAQLAQDDGGITVENLQQAQWISGYELTADEQAAILTHVNSGERQLQALRRFPIDHDVSPAVCFQTLAHTEGPDVLPNRAAAPREAHAGVRPTQDDQLAFLPVSELAPLIRTRQVSSEELTDLYLRRLKRFDPLLKCVVTLTEDLALKQARQADREIAAGHYRGPLHGIPWGAKDLMSVAGYPTTWGIPAFADRCLDRNATVYERLRDAGAVLVAKTSLGALAMGDQWFRGMTRNPWNPQQGSSGSSAGSVAATVAGLVGFSMGSETLGSIMTPSARCGATGLRPTFGRISRDGCMPLSWTMDKLGPICRSADDCALVLDAIHGADGRDPTAVNRPFKWPTDIDFRRLRIGHLARHADQFDRAPWSCLQELGCQLVEVELPSGFPLGALIQTINIEGASVFEDMLRARETEGWNTWPNSFRAAQFVSAVDYVRAMRVRRQLMEAFDALMERVDILVNCSDLMQTNLTGHPSVIFPTAIEERDGRWRPQSTVFTGRLFDEARLLTIAAACQQRIGPLALPPLEQWLAQDADNDDVED